jgi:hypothetical protein
MHHRFLGLFLSLLVIGCGPRDDDSMLDASVPDPDGGLVDGDVDAVIPESHCVGRDGEDLGPPEPPTDACALADAEPSNEIAAAACLALEPYLRGEFSLPFDLLLGDVTHRRFGVSALSHLWGEYLEILKAWPMVEWRSYGRVGDASMTMTAEELATLESVNAVTGPALHCLDHPLPERYPELLEDDLALGGYPATHVLMALFWLDDLGCESPTDEAFYEEAVATTEALIDDDHATTTDLEIESAAFLAYIGEGHRVPAGFLEGVLANQLPEGGWTDVPGGGADGHTTGLGLWYLHELLFPGRFTTMVTPCVRRAASG